MASLSGPTFGACTSTQERPPARQKVIDAQETDVSPLISFGRLGPRASAQARPVQRSMSACALVCSKYTPTAMHPVRDGHETASRNPSSLPTFGVCEIVQRLPRHVSASVWLYRPPRRPTAKPPPLQRSIRVRLTPPAVR